MSNCKQLLISGIAPFNIRQNEAALKYLGQLNTPTSGIRILWTYWGFEPNDHGGETAMYRFQIGGLEAISDVWIRGLLYAFADKPGKITFFSCLDIELNQRITMLELGIAHEITVDKPFQLP